MSARLLTVCRSLVFAALLFAVPHSEPRQVSSPDGDQLAREVRLRKLHLVRPDLIPYPIHFEIYC